MTKRTSLSAVLASVLVRVRRRGHKDLENLRAAWGRPVLRERVMEVISAYHRSASAPRPTVDDHTWDDLGMDELFAQLDRTVSTPGRQVLYDQMRVYADDEVLAERARQQEIFVADQNLRERCQLLLATLEGRQGEGLASFLTSPFPTAPWFAPLLYVSSGLTVACLVGIAWVHFLLLPALFLILLNVGITAFYTHRLRPYFSACFQVVRLLSVGEALAKLPNEHGLPQLRSLREAVRWVRSLKSKLGWLAIDRATLNDLVASAFEYLNMITLYDALVYLRSLTILNQHQNELIGLFQAVGSLDAAVAAASYFQSLPLRVRPMLVSEPRIDVDGLIHPLITNPVGNELALVNRSALITGPNMAGKTAFIRTVGINVILAQTLNFCVAERAVLPRAVVRSSIRREDSLKDGESYFFTEIQQIGAFSQLNTTGKPHLFLIDEIFRGTNTIERIAAASAVLRHLSQRGLVFATTHDVELQALLADTFTMYHFSDQVVHGVYRFDYRIHLGPARSRNAIKLLALSGYPAEVIHEAERLATRLLGQPEL